MAGGMERIRERTPVTPDEPVNDCWHAKDCRHDDRCQFYKHCALEAWY